MQERSKRDRYTSKRKRLRLLFEYGKESGVREAIALVNAIRNY
ncbi:MAG TPA: hypothetical protein V6D09_12355 [Leptolyngbyaceae cyanobacterium]